MKSFLSGILAVLSLSPVAYAQSVSMRYLDLFIEGGATAGYYFSGTSYDKNFNTFSSYSQFEFNRNAENILLNDALLELRTGPLHVMNTEFRMGMGHLSRLTILDGNGNLALGSQYIQQAPVSSTSSQDLNVTRRQLEAELIQSQRDDVNIYYAQMAISPAPYVLLEAGRLATHLGYEVSPSYTNWNSGFGLVWMKQPTYYNGFRLSYEFEKLNAYLEFNQDDSFARTPAVVAGLFGKSADMRYSAAFYFSDYGHNLFDAMVESGFDRVTIAANIDVHIVQGSAQDINNRVSLAAAVYLIPHIMRFDLPLRLEIIRDSQAGMYDMSRGYSLTFTPTARLAENFFVRAEFAFISSYNGIFRGLQDELVYYEKTDYSLQFGYYF
ncbi:MAG: porin [Gammaproteobacteria bacterium]|nr:porin [Gammaproteobacteria bacterium]